MTDCERMFDRMPAVARGASVWDAGEAAHLATCTACQEEWQLVRLAAGLGEQVGLSVDPARVAARVASRLQAESAPAVRVLSWPRRLVLPLAVAAAVVLAVWTGQPGGSAPAQPAETVTAMLHELDDLDADELELMLEAVDLSGGSTYRPLDARESLGDLSDAELEAVLSTLEG